MAVFGFGVLVAVGLAWVLYLARRALAIRAVVLFNAATPYECGFDPVGRARTPFSLRFFLLGIIFLLFDVEVAVLFPLLFVVGERSVAGVGGLFFFLFVLLAGLLHEWREGSLDWA